MGCINVARSISAAEQLGYHTHHAGCRINVADSLKERYANWCVLLLIWGDYGRLPTGHSLCFNLTLDSDRDCQTTHFSGAEHLLLLKTTCRQAASGSFIMTTSLGRLAVLLFLCLLRSVIEMRSLYKGFYRTAVNTARAGKNDPFPCRHEDIFITVSLQQLSFQNLSKAW